MSEPKLISPLLDGVMMGDPMSEHDGVICCPAMMENSDSKYIVKIISVPASQVQLDALLLTGAYKDPAAALEYFKSLSEDIIAEAEVLQKLSKLEGFESYEKWQIVPMENNRLGYDVYLVGSYKRSLDKFMRRNPITHLAAVNLGLDMCAALSASRNAGYMYVDLKPSNIFITDDREFRIGDLGFVALDSLKYTSLPTKYRSGYTAPELKDVMATINDTADVYALGMVLYQIHNNGVLPALPGPEDEPLAAPLNADYEIAEIILKACAADPKDRWATPMEMGQALAAYMQRNTVNDDPICPPMGILPGTAEPINGSDEPKAVPAEEPETTDVPEEVTVEAETEPVAEEVTEAEAFPVEDVPAQPEPEAQPEENAEAVEEAPAAEADPTAATINISQAAVEAAAEEMDDRKTMVITAAPPKPKRTMLQIFDEDDEYDDDEFEDDEDAMDEMPAQDNGGKKKKNPLLILLAVVLTCALAVGAFYFYNNYYLLTINELEVNGHHNQITVTVNADFDESLLTVVLSDTYGNTKRVNLTDGQAVFTDLSPDTLYQVQLEVSGFHKLDGRNYGSYITSAETRIVNFTGITGNEDGSVILNFGVEGPEKTPDWNVTYVAEGEDPVTVPFSGHNVTITGLTLDKVYTFTLTPTTDLFMVGENTLEFTASRIILAEDLTITACNEGSLTAQWSAPEGVTVNSWNVRCYSNDGVEQTASTNETTFTFQDIQADKSYTVEITAEGMTQTVRTTISANPITVSNIQVDDSEPEKLTVTWEFSGTAPEGGWQLLYYVDNSETAEVARSESNSAAITKRIPGATYTLVLQAADGTTVFQDTFTYDCPEAEEYVDNKFMLPSTHINSNLLVTPGESWSYEDVNANRDYTDTFTSGDSISILLRATIRSFYLYNDSVDIMYVVRDSEGNVQQSLVRVQTIDWCDIWNDKDFHYGELNLPIAPTEAGDYTLYLYFDGYLVATNNFTVVESEQTE